MISDFETMYEMCMQKINDDQKYQEMFYKAYLEDSDVRGYVDYVIKANKEYWQNQNTIAKLKPLEMSTVGYWQMAHYNHGRIVDALRALDTGREATIALTQKMEEICGDYQPLYSSRTLGNFIIDHQEEFEKLALKVNNEA